MRYLLLFSILITIGLISCKDEPCEDIKLNLTSLESEYGCTSTASQMEITGSDNILIITNQSDFEANIGGSCLPTIDFSKYILLIGKQALTNGLESITYELIDDCDGENYDFNVNLKMNATTVAPVVTYHSLAPILEGGQVNFNITVSN